MDPMQLAPWLGGAFTALGALMVAFREKARRAALQAERELESEKQESRAQEHTLTRLRTLEGRVDNQAELVATQQQQIHGLTTENRQQAALLARQDAVIRRQARHIGDQARTIREQAERITQLEADVGRKDHDNEVMAKEMHDLRMAILGSSAKPSGLPADLYRELPKKPR